MAHYRITRTRHSDRATFNEIEKSNFQKQIPHDAVRYVRITIENLPAFHREKHHVVYDSILRHIYKHCNLTCKIRVAKMPRHRTVCHNETVADQGIISFRGERAQYICNYATMEIFK